jgi:hypothetical protein
LLFFQRESNFQFLPSDINFVFHIGFSWTIFLCGLSCGKQFKKNDTPLIATMRTKMESVPLG